MDLVLDSSSTPNVGYLEWVLQQPIYQYSVHQYFVDGILDRRDRNGGIHGMVCITLTGRKARLDEILPSG